MLKSIFIRNIALIDKLEINFNKGLCILSGETGSGKSILLDAIGLAIGARSGSKILRQGFKSGFVVAEFFYKKNSLCHKFLIDNALEGEEEGVVFLKRNVTINGNKAFINDIPVSLSILVKIGNLLLEVHGQHQQKNLFETSFHKNILDKYADCDVLAQEVKDIFQDWRESERCLQDIIQNQVKIVREREYLVHIIAEIEELNIIANEEQLLLDQKMNLNNKTKILQLLQEAELNNDKANLGLFSSQQDFIRNKERAFNKDMDMYLENAIDKIEEITAKSDELKEIFNDINQSLGSDEFSLEEIEERLFKIKNISRKLNINSDQIGNFLIESKNKLNVLNKSQEDLCLLEKKVAEFKQIYLEKAELLSKIRQKKAIVLKEEVERELQFLKMREVRFLAEVKTITEESDFRSDGINKVVFLASTNKNSPFGNISTIASGGELSRFMLALKVSMLKVISVPVLIFDEIDTGVGGAVSEAIGQRLKKLSENYQVMVITHQPQIASKADFHLKVSKIHYDLESLTKAEILDDNQRAGEIARMLSGQEVTPEAVAAAKRLMSG